MSALKLLLSLSLHGDNEVPLMTFVPTVEMIMSRHPGASDLARVCVKVGGVGWLGVRRDARVGWPGWVVGRA